MQRWQKILVGMMGGALVIETGLIGLLGYKCFDTFKQNESMVEVGTKFTELFVYIFEEARKQGIEFDEFDNIALINMIEEMQKSVGRSDLYVHIEEQDPDN